MKIQMQQRHGNSNNQMQNNNGRCFHSVFNCKLFLQDHCINTQSAPKSLLGKLFCFFHCLVIPITVHYRFFNIRLKTPVIQSLVVSFTVGFYKMYPFLPHLLKIYFFKELITQYSTTGSTVIINEKIHHTWIGKIFLRCQFFRKRFNVISMQITATFQ